MSIYKNAFNGSDYIPIRDDARLSRQIDRVYACMKDGKRRTLSQISRITGDPEASVSAQLRHLKKPKFAAQFPNIDVKKNNLGGGLYEYWLVRTDKAQLELV
jgi:predicted transcriptional regulator